MMRKAVLSALSAGFLALAPSAPSLAAPPLGTAPTLPAPPAGAAPSVPEAQLTYSQSGIRVSLSGLVLGGQAGAVTLTIENDRDEPVYVAALYARSAGGKSQAVLSDNSGDACMADMNPIGITEIPHLAQVPKPAISALTAIPPHTRMNAIFRFTGCRLASPPLSFAGEFALSTNGRDVALLTVPLWGIVPATGARP